LILEQHFLKTERLGFGKWKKELLSQAICIWGDPKVTKLIGGQMSDEQIQERLNSEIRNYELYKVQYWPIFLLESNVIVGCCGLRPYCIEENIYELGFHITSSFWRQGFAFEAVNELIKYAFSQLKVSCLFAGHNPQNEPSRRLLKKIGFHYSHDEFYPPTNLNHPSYFFYREDYTNMLNT
jgi:ribosomal-protein-alanine N-acetyltransferase